MEYLVETRGHVLERFQDIKREIQALVFRWAALVVSVFVLVLFVLIGFIVVYGEILFLMLQHYLLSML